MKQSSLESCLSITKKSNEELEVRLTMINYYYTCNLCIV